MIDLLIKIQGIKYFILIKKMNFFYNEDETPDDKEIASVRYEMFVQELERTNNYLQQCGVPFTIITPTSHKKYFKNQFKK